ncbi:AAA domain-containing protein [Shimia aestuarii]|uniref:AAA domain-containing protein n=1 Tax=Shimia aestuarii TaxID=254406 RepID=UPI001FB33CB8|nr:AAA domain-containing protein [Shimia aestuarii]
MDHLSILKYWRSSLADGALGKGRFSERDRKKLMELPKASLRDGTLPKNQLRKVFEGQKPDTEFVAVRIWPMVTARKKSHGATISNGYPDFIAPVVSDAVVRRDGKILPTRSVIARDVLTPLPNDVFALGNIDEFDHFLASSPFAPDENSPVWPQYLQHSRAMLDAVSPSWPTNDQNYVPTGFGFLEVAEDSAATIAQVISMYDNVISDQPDTPLLKKLGGKKPETRDLSPKTEATFKNRLGHASDKFPLADHQRQVLSYLSTSSNGDVLAVNGPPGTGKTTMLLSAIADAWVRAALEESHPPVIVAASTNNQAVTNIIDAFGKDFGEGEGPFSGRWLPDLKSYGLFLPAKTKEAEAAKKYQTERFFDELESEEYVIRARDVYLSAAKVAFPRIENPDVEKIVEALLARITLEVSKLHDMDEAENRLSVASKNVSDLLGSDHATEMANLETVFDDLKERVRQHKSWVAAWTKHQAEESLLLALFGFIPAISRKRCMQGRVALEEAGCDVDFSSTRSLSDVSKCLKQSAQTAKKSAQSARQKRDAAKSALENFTRAEQSWERAVLSLGFEEPQNGILLEVDRYADCHSRFDLFRLACHYWEGRWLLEMEENLEEVISSKRKTGKKSAVPRWLRRMMITPCAVSTFASLPGKMSYRHKADDAWHTGFLYNFIDLLIVDEAGQVLPEVAAPSFALAKRALVIGDTQQIEPISSLSTAVDIGNLQSVGFIKESYSEDELKALSQTGIRSVDGSAMRLAQQACAFEPYPELERGLYLFEHRRCFDEIINFCNTLCYKGSLIPKRGNAPENKSFPSIGYLHIDGMAEQFGGSRANRTEASTIAEWLSENRNSLENQYQHKIEDIVGIVTPFGRQAQELRNACSNVGINKGMTIGTVHSLQGAERPVIIFSPVYSKHSDGSFIDASPSMLNVTVSRAKDCFLVFGDMDVFSTAAKGSPRSVLADCLFAQSRSSLEFTSQPRADLRRADSPLTTLRDAGEHDNFLKEALKTAQEITIVSPWIIQSTMQRAGLLDALDQAIQRGAKVDIYADPLLNQLQYADGTTQMEAAKNALDQIGVKLHEVRQLHSKIVIVDDNQLCIGSYNWLSADRKGKYARHETSILYSGSHLQSEIDVLRESLGVREKKIA